MQHLPEDHQWLMVNQFTGLRAVCGFTEAKDCHFPGARVYLICLHRLRADSLSAYRHLGTFAVEDTL